MRPQDIHAFTELYERHVAEIYRFIFIRTGGETGPAEDLTQDVFLDACRGFPRFRGASTVRTWLFRIARNKVIDWYRGDVRHRRESLSLKAESVQDVPDPSQDWDRVLEALTRSDEVLGCLRELPRHYRIVLLLKHVEGCSVRDIAAWMDRTPKSVDNLLQRAKAQFVASWKTHGASLKNPDNIDGFAGPHRGGKEQQP